MRKYWCMPLIVLSLLISAQLARAEEKVDFNRDIRPILSDNCFACHGPDKAKRKADLRLDTKEGLFGEIDDNFPIVAGKPDKSEVFLRLVSEDEDEKMPPKKANKTLSKQQIELIRKWIEQGAEFKGHWAYVKLEAPAAKRDATARTTIDAFLAAKLKQNGLTPAAEADRVTLIRRLYFDLLGLPPTPAEVKAFVEDKSAGAYDGLVDPLLASPHFGERMAQHWLDWVRFGDTNGIHSDNPVNIWPYRDYVINAFNANKRFDQFTIEQIAGDLLPNPTLEQRIASGYNRLLITTEEGGAQPKEYTAKYGADRVRNVSAVWLGQTMGCAECHDHKFDPIMAKDFYAMKAFFADVEEAAVGKREPGMPVPTPAQAAQLEHLDDQMAALRDKLNVESPELAAEQARWEAEQVRGAEEWQTLQPQDAKVLGESKLKQEEGGVLRSVYKLAANETFVITVKSDLKDIAGFRLEALDDDEYPARGPGGSPNGNFVMTEFKVATVGKDGKSAPVKLRNPRADYSQDGFNVAGLIDGKDDTGWAILPQVGKPHMAMFEVEKPLAGDGGETTIVFTLEFKSRYPQHQIAKLRLSATTTPNPASRWLPTSLQKIIATAPEQRDDRQKKELAAFYRSVAPMLQPIREELAATQKRKDELEKSLPTTLVTTAMAKPRTVRILQRGNWLDDSGPEVESAIPEFLGKLDVNGRRANRMDLAKSLETLLRARHQQVAGGPWRAGGMADQPGPARSSCG
jgi:mono/diheme cytochrome c family protein